ncbi:hypothetical protein D3C72_1674890 [compost metagenome]
MGDVAGAEGHVDQRMGGFRGIALVPVRLAQPVADLQRVGVVDMWLQRAAAEEFAVFGLGNRIDAFANLASIRASHEIGRIACRVRVRHARYHGGNGGVVGEMGKGVDVFLVGRAHDEPLRQQDGAIAP